MRRKLSAYGKYFPPLELRQQQKYLLQVVRKKKEEEEGLCQVRLLKWTQAPPFSGPEHSSARAR